MKTFTLLTGLVCLALSASAHAKPGSLDKAVAANNLFGFELYKQIKRAEAKPDQNRLVSPVSAYFALAMASNGARTETESAMRKAIAASGMTRPELNAQNLALLDELNSRKDFQLELANSVWTREGFGLLATFSDAATKYYRADARELDFSSPEAAPTINGWVSDKTHGKIKEVVKAPLDDDFYLMNATYFKGSWTYPFSEELTKAATFYGTKGKSSVPTLHGNFISNYLKRDSYEVVEMPYGEQGQASMLLFVTDNLDRLEETLNAEEWNKISADLQKPEQSYQITLSIPKFEFEDEADLKEPLTDLGMGVAFTPAADFRDLTRSGIVLTKAFQKTYIKLDEKGTEAAAVTVIAGTTSVPMVPQVTVNADKPFLVAIRDNVTGAILFVGAVVNP